MTSSTRPHRRVAVTPQTRQILELLVAAPHRPLPPATITAATTLAASTVRDNLIRLTTAGWLTAHPPVRSRTHSPTRYRITPHALPLVQAAVHEVRNREHRHSTVRYHAPPLLM